jgi:HemY protein
VNTLIFVLATFAIALALGLVAMEDPGYVLIARAPYEIEVSLALFVLLLVLAFSALYLGVRFLMRAANARDDLARWNARRHREQAGRDILHGYARLIEGDFEEAERELTIRVAHSDTPLLNHLGAAYAAQQKGDFARRDAYLDAATTSGKRFRDAISLTRARLQYQAGQITEARATLEAMPAALRRRTVVQRMEAEVLRRLEDFSALEKRLPYYRRHGAFAAEELTQLEQDAHGRLLRHEAPMPTNPNELTRAWSSLPESRRHDTANLIAYLEKLKATGQLKQAADLIRNELHHHWNPALVPVFIELKEDRAEQIRQLLVWLERHPDDAQVLYGLAHLKNQAGDDESAQDFYARAIRNGAGEKAYLELGELLERAGETTEALRCYRRGLEVREVRSTRATQTPARFQSSTANSKES